MAKIHLTKNGIKKILIVILISIFLVGIIIAVNFEQVYNPFTRQLDYYRSLNMSGENMTIGNVTADYFFGTLNWSDLSGYPVACPAGYYVTQIDDSITCTEIDLSNFVPYTGANANVDLGSYNLTIDDTLQLTNTTTTWNMYVDVNGTLVWEQE